MISVIITVIIITASDTHALGAHPRGDVVQLLARGAVARLQPQHVGQVARRGAQRAQPLARRAAPLIRLHVRRVQPDSLRAVCLRLVQAGNGFVKLWLIYLFINN